MAYAWKSTKNPEFIFRMSTIGQGGPEALKDVTRRWKEHHPWYPCKGTFEQLVQEHDPVQVVINFERRVIEELDDVNDDQYHEDQKWIFIINSSGNPPIEIFAGPSRVGRAATLVQTIGALFVKEEPTITIRSGIAQRTANLDEEHVLYHNFPQYCRDNEIYFQEIK